MKDKRNKAAWELAKTLWSMNSVAETAVKEALEDSISSSIRKASGILPKHEISAQLEKAAKNVKNERDLSWSTPTTQPQSGSGFERISQSSVRPLDIPITTPPIDIPPVKLPGLLIPRSEAPPKTPFLSQNDGALPGIGERGSLTNYEPSATRLPGISEMKSPRDKITDAINWAKSMPNVYKMLADTGIINDSVSEPKPVETLDIEANWYENEPRAAAKSAVETLATEQNKRYNIPDAGKQDIETLAIYDDWYKETEKPLVEWPEDDSPEPTQAAQPAGAQLPLISSSAMMAATQRSNIQADTGVRSFNESQGNTVDWKAGATPGNSTITISSGGKYLSTLKEGLDYYIDSNGTAQYYNQPGNSVRDAYDGNVAWVPGTDGGASGSKIVTPDGTLKESVDYYVGNDGRAYFYNDDWYKDTVKPYSEKPVSDSTEIARAGQPASTQLPPNNLSVTMAAAQLSNNQAGIGVRSFNESLGNKVEWQAGATPGKSTITITSGGKNSTTLLEGEDFSIGPDGKAYYLSQPKISVRDVYGSNLEWVPGINGGASGSKIVTPDGTLKESVDYYVGEDGKAYFKNDDWYRDPVKSSIERLVYDSTEAARVVPLASNNGRSSDSKDVYMDEALAASLGLWDGYGDGLFSHKQLQSVFTEAGHWQAKTLTVDMSDGLSTLLLHTGAITTKQQMQYFLAVCLFESKDSLTEAGYLSETAARKYCEKYEWSKRLGNTKSGDGYKFRGAGYIQLTGRYNYQLFSDYIKDKYGYDPKIMSEGADYVAKAYPWETAVWFWETNDISGVINRGNENGLDEIEILKQVSNAVYAGNAYEKSNPYDWDVRQTKYKNVKKVY